MQVQEQVLKEALREVEREQKRVNFAERPTDMEYLKNTCAMRRNALRCLVRARETLFIEHTAPTGGTCRATREFTVLNHTASRGLHRGETGQSFLNSTGLSMQTDHLKSVADAVLADCVADKPHRWCCGRVLQLYQTREMAPMLLPVLATMLHFSPTEVAKCQEAVAATAPTGVCAPCNHFLLHSSPSYNMSFSREAPTFDLLKTCVTSGHVFQCVQATAAVPRMGGYLGPSRGGLASEDSSEQQCSTQGSESSMQPGRVLRQGYAGADWRRVYIQTLVVATISTARMSVLLSCYRLS